MDSRHLARGVDVGQRLVPQKLAPRLLGGVVAAARVVLVVLCEVPGEALELERAPARGRLPDVP